MIRLMKYLKKIDWLFLVIAAGLIVAQVYFELTMPDFTKNLTTIVSEQQSGIAGDIDQGAVWYNGGMMLLCAAGSLVCAIVCSFFVSFVASDFSASLRDSLYKKILSFSNKDIHRFHTASLITRTTNDVVQLQNFVAMGTQLLLKAPVMAVWAIVKISDADITWTMATVITVIVIAVFVTIGIILCVPKFTKMQKYTDDLNAAASENISGVRVIRAFNAEEFQNKKYEAVNDKITNTNLFVSRVTGLMNPILTLAMNGLTLAIYWIAAVLINRIPFDPTNPTEAYAAITDRAAVIANMTVFSQYSLQVIMSFLMLVLVFLLLPRVIVSGKRINEVLKQEPSIVDGDGNTGDLHEISVPAIVFDHVDFSYAGDEHYAIKGIDLTIDRGETVAFIGATGCGKTTIINLLMRFYEVSNGAIYVNGADVRNYRLADLRKEISYAPQKPSLLKGTIKSNVTYGQGEVDGERLQRALDGACCDFVKENEKGVDAEVAQGGTNFSGGQKQRISIARAIYKNADILVFDDSFSALDFKTDSIVRKNIHRECAGKTVLIVAQRIGTIRNADKIVVMDKGRIVGVGKHEELMKGNEVYREIALSQLSEEEL